MTEREKMMAGLKYFDTDEELVSMRRNSKKILQKLNYQVAPDDYEQIKALETELFGYPVDYYIEYPFYCNYGVNIKMKKGVWLNFNCTILDTNTITLGENVFFGPNVVITADTHPNDVEEGEEFRGQYSLPVTIGDNAWIGAGAIILPGVTIGENSVIGAGSVVTKSIPANCVAVGSPCKIIKQIK